MPPIIAININKGGAGKSTTAFHVARHLARYYNVLVIDLDSQAGITSRMMGKGCRVDISVADVLLGEAPLADAVFPRLPVSGSPSLLPSHRSLGWAAAKMQAMSPNHAFLGEALAVTHAYAYDVILLDCAPAADILIVNALACATHVVIPATPTEESWQAIERVHQQVESIGRQLRVTPQIIGVVATQVVTNSNSHKYYVDLMRPHLLGCVPLRTGADAAADIAAAYAPISDRIAQEVGLCSTN